MPHSPPEHILLGRIADAHGIRGEVLVHSFAELPEHVATYGALTDKAGTRQFALKILHATTKGLVCRIAGVGDRNAAEALKGTELYIARDKLPAVAVDEFYHADLIGLAAVTEDGTAVGAIVTVQNFGSGDLLEIALTGSRTTEFLPFTEAFVPEIDIGGGRVVVRLPVEDDDDDEAAEPSAQGSN